MGDKRILIAIADPHTLAEYGRALAKEWTVRLVTGPEAALAEMALCPCDVLVADVGLTQINGKDLFDRINFEFPRTIRILLAGEMDAEHRLTALEGSRVVLNKPCDGATLKSAIERALAIDLWLPNDKLREFVSQLRTFPIVPSLYLEVINALKTSNTTTAEIGSIIAKDMAMMTKLLQITNSACFGLPRRISDPVEAVGILGFETVKSMVMTLKLFSQYDKIKPVYFSIDRLWRHSTEVARISRRVALTQTEDPALVGSAFTAGLMHDLGKLVLAANFDEQYSGAQALARKQQIPLWEVEKQIFGANHGEIGAYLLGIWGMPLDLVEASALHHNPGRSQADAFTPLTAVHVANALVYELKPDKEGYVAPQIDMDYLAALNLTDQVTSWRAMIVTSDLEVTEFRSRSGETVVLKKPAPLAPPLVKSAPNVKKAAPLASFTIPQPRWLYGGMALVIFLLAFLIGTQALVRMTLPPANIISANAAKPPPKLAAPLLPPAHLMAVVTPPVKVEVKTNPAPVVVADPSPASNPVVAIAPIMSVTIPPPEPPPLSAKDRAFADLHLQTILYSQTNPTAIISGSKVRPQDRLPAGALVVDIGPSSVTLEFEHERKILAFK